MRGLPDWTRACGQPLFAARIRSVPSDFIVVENLSVDFSDDGEHDLLCVEKAGANSQWVAERLAKHAKVSARDVGYSGMKDRHAITRQWFSVRRPVAAGTDWGLFDAEGVEVIEQRRHHRKLRRGTHKSNFFRIALRNDRIGEFEADIAARLMRIEAGGVPNYFGEQRFGRDGANVELCRAMFAGRRLSRNRRSIALSTARSWVFNQIVDTRVQEGSWNTVLRGELVNLDGSGSVFAVEEVTDEFDRRCVEMDIHPTGSLWGEKAPLGTGEVAELEGTVAAANSELCEGLINARVDAAARPLRLRVHGLKWEFGDGAVWLEFTLGRGGYATSVLREIATW